MRKKNSSEDLLAKRQAISAEYAGAHSVCTCGHTGDIAANVTPDLDKKPEHAGIMGHGFCKVCPEGKCEKFTWKEYTPEFEKLMRDAEK